MTIEQEILTIALKKCFKGRYFDVCTIDDLAKMKGITINQKVKVQLRPLHCIDYSEMSPRVREWLIETCVGIFTQEPIDLTAIEEMFTPAEARVIKIQPAMEVEEIVQPVLIPQHAEKPKEKGFLRKLLS